MNSDKNNEQFGEIKYKILAFYILAIYMLAIV